MSRSRSTIRRLRPLEGEHHRYRPGPEDERGRTVCRRCGELWEHPVHVHDVRDSPFSGPRSIP